jgi:hypothetical protein
LFQPSKLRTGQQSMDYYPQEKRRVSRSMDTCPAPRPRRDGVAVHRSAE